MSGCCVPIVTLHSIPVLLLRCYGTTLIGSGEKPVAAVGEINIDSPSFASFCPLLFFFLPLISFREPRGEDDRGAEFGGAVKLRYVRVYVHTYVAGHQVSSPPTGVASVTYVVEGSAMYVRPLASVTILRDLVNGKLLLTVG